MKIYIYIYVKNTLISFHIMAKRTISGEELCKILPMPGDICNIIYKYIGNPFIITLDIDTHIIIPHIESSNGFYIDWGDNKCDCISDIGINVRHNYVRSGRYIVHIFGDIINISFKCMYPLVEISQWGNLRLYNGYAVFNACKNLIITAHDQLNLRYVTSLSNMFSNCYSLVADLSKWDVSNIADMSHMFYGCKLFSSDLSRWNVSNVTNMIYMFNDCSSFDSDLSKWNVKKVTKMYSMFGNCRAFNSNLSEWNVGKVTDTSSMFAGCDIFNSDLRMWDVSNVLNMANMFYDCKTFNSDLSLWDVSNVINMCGVFQNCNTFNSDLSQWDVSNVNNMHRMFYGCYSIKSELLSKFNLRC